MKLKPWMVSVLCLIIALPLVANSAFSAPITTADLIDPHRVDADCANYDEQNGTHGGGQGEEVDEGFTLECRDRVHRVDNKLHGGLNIVGHMVGGSLLMLSAPITFNSNVLRNRKRLHRAAGYTFIVGGVIVGVAAILMTVIFPHRFYPFTAFANLLWSGLLLVALVLALRAAVQKKFKVHRAWMIRAYAVAAGPAFHRWFFFLQPIIGDFGISLGAVIVGELIIRKIGLSTLREMNWSVGEGRLTQRNS
jgi:hypothetical protein|tara:strand:- start:1 stop:750 length:750 start_codon:yes stop_codon:yes gene_type:complete